MSKKKVKVVKEAESLSPTTSRTFSATSYALTFVGMSVAINGFMFGSSIVPPAGVLNLWQAFVAIIVGLTICVVFITLNGAAGHKYGIPFTVQARSSFGITGSKIPGLIRSVPAVFWYGIQTWIGATAINGVSVLLFGFDNAILFFILFQVLHILLSSLGFKGVKWLETVGSVFLILGLFYMLYMVNKAFGVEIADLSHIQGSWGMPFWAAAGLFLGNFNTVAINIGDLSKELDKNVTSKGQLLFTWIGLVPTTFIMGVIGLIVAGATGQWDPVKALMEIIPGNFFLIIVLFFIALSQLTTNIVNNVLPVAFVFMDLFKTTYVKASVVVGFMAMLIMPGKIATATAFTLFVQIYSAFLGPIVAVMIVDYYFVRDRTIEINLLYDTDSYYQGYNWPGLIALIVGAGFALLNLDIGWFLSIIPAGLTYYLLMRYYPINKGFLKGSHWENNMDGFTPVVKQSDK